MNENSRNLSIADFAALISALLLGFAFLALPWVGITDFGTTGFKLLTDSEPLIQINSSEPLIQDNFLLLQLIPIAAIVALIATLVGIFNDSARRMTSIITTIAGAVAVAYFVLFFWQNNQAIVEIDIRLGFGFWMSLFTSVVLVYQITIPRPPEEISAVDLTIDLLRVLIIVIVIAGAANTILSGKFSIENYVSLFIAGLAQGSIYALIALGYTLVYGIMLMINFAHGEVFMAGAFTTMFLARWLDGIDFLNTYPIISVLIMIVFSGFISMMVAILLERIAYRPLRGSPRLVPLITAIGASFFLQYMFAGLYGSGNFAYPNIDKFSGTVRISGFQIPISYLYTFFIGLFLLVVLFRLIKRNQMSKAKNDDSQEKQGFRLADLDLRFLLISILVAAVALAISAWVTNQIFVGSTFTVNELAIPQAQLIVFFSALTLMGMLYWLVERTKLGKAMRAVSEDKEVARLMGIDVDFIILFTFAVGGALAGAAGVVNGIFRPQGVKFTMGFIPGIKAFTAAVLGGIGNVPGAMLGGLFLGVIEALGPNLVLGGLGIPSANQLKDVIAFTMLVLVLIFRPQGIMGERLTEKKA